MSSGRCNAVIRVRRTAGTTKISTCRGDASDDNGTPVETTMPVHDRRNDPVAEMTVCDPVGVRPARSAYDRGGSAEVSGIVQA